MAPLPAHLQSRAVGREQISKSLLAEHQRGRVLAAAASVFAGRGYQSTTVGHIVSAGRIGVGSFYALFEGKEDCFLRLYDQIVAEGGERIGAAAAGEEGWADRVLAGLRTLLELVAAEPDRARVVIVEARTAGPAAESRYADTIATLTAILREGRATPSGDAEPPPAFEEAAVPGIAWFLHQRLTAGDPVIVDELLPELADFVLSPYVGDDVAIPEA